MAINPGDFLHGIEHRLVLLKQLAAALDARIGDQDVQIVPECLGKLRLLVQQVHDAQIRREIVRRLLEGRARDAAPLRVRPQAGDAIGEVGCGGADRIRGHQRMTGGAQFAAPLANSGCGRRLRRRGLRCTCIRLPKQVTHVKALCLCRGHGQCGQQQDAAGDDRFRHGAPPVAKKGPSIKAQLCLQEA